jgi:hypothetical protein
LSPFGSAEVDVSRAESQAVGLADDGTHHNFGGEAQVGNHAADDGYLGRVFLAEEGAVGLRGDEQLGDYGGYAAKVAGAGCAVKAVAQAFDFNESGCTGWVELFDRWSEDDVCAFGLGQSAVGVKAAWIAGKVFVGSELGWVDEDADGDAAARIPGSSDPRRSNQRRVACVQSAHGRNQADSIAAAPFLTGPMAKLGNSAKDFHRNTYIACFPQGLKPTFNWRLLRHD